jgi:hypothetical protein
MDLKEMQQPTAAEAREWSERAATLAEMIVPFFQGQPPQVVLATLAELMARVVTGLHVGSKRGVLDPEATAEIREKALTQWCEVVRAMAALRNMHGTLQ